MPTISADEIVTNRHKRNFIQFGGPRPTNAVGYAGQDAQYLSIEGVTVPESGGIDPIFVPDPRVVGKYKLVGRKISPPDLAKATLKMLERHGSIPKQLLRIGCQFNLYELTGACKDLSDFVGGWSDYVLLYSGAMVTDKDLGSRTGWDSDEQIETSLSLILSDIYPVGALSFGEQASTQVDREVLDIVYGSNQQCGDCGVPDDGTKNIYAIVKSSGAGSPGLPAELVWSNTYGSTWQQMTITGLGATADPVFVDIVGTRVVVGVNTELAYYWSDIDVNGNPSTTWTKVTAGFVAAKGPNDIHVVSAREVYIVGDGGYVYKSTDITAGVTAINAGVATVQNLRRVHGNGSTLVAVGGASTAIKSLNSGATFATTTVAPSLISTNLDAVAVLDARRYWVGSALGRVVYTLDGGETWAQISFDNAGVGTVKDIVAATDEVLYFSHSLAAPTARLFSSWNGGADWTRIAPRINGWPVFGTATRLAVPLTDPGVASNNIAIGGLSGGGTDGIILLGIASKF